MNPGQYTSLRRLPNPSRSSWKQQYKQIGYKRVHLVVAAPKQENIEGRCPRCLSLVQHHASMKRASAATGNGQYIDVEFGSDGQAMVGSCVTAHVAASHYLISCCWAQTLKKNSFCSARRSDLHGTSGFAAEQLMGDSFEADDYIPLLPRSWMKRCCPASGRA